MIKKINISVIITTFNSASCISEAIQSVLQQRGVTVEIVIVDDHSSDFNLMTTLAIAFNKKCKITILQPESKGNANISRNIGIQNAQYAYVAFLDADDTWNTEHLISCVESIEKDSLDGCFSRVNLISNSNVTQALPVYETQSDICDFIFNQGGISVTSSLVINKLALTEVTFNNALYKHQDWDFLVRFCKINKLGQSPYYGLNYTLSTGTNMSSKFNFDASIMFMNNTLPIQWHNVFLSTQINKIITEKKYNELVILRRKLKDNYQYSISLLGLKNKIVIYGSFSRSFFILSVALFKTVDSIKRKIRLFIKRS